MLNPKTSLAYEKGTTLFRPVWFVCAPAACPFSGRCRGVDAWFKAAPVSGNLQGRYQWLDFSGDSVVQYAQNRVSGTYVFTQGQGLWSSR